jgi:hypothetical protein
MSRIVSNENVAGLLAKLLLLLVVAFGSLICRAAEESGKKDAKTANSLLKKGTGSELIPENTVKNNWSEVPVPLFQRAAKPAQVSKVPDHNYGPALDGKGRTSMFGIEGVGYRFVYVIDRSGSMGGDGNAALRAAKAELLASIKKLERTHAFQIVFYNDRTAKFDPSGNGQAVYATDRNKDAAERFLDSISAQGGTEHEAALRMALKIKPDVVFWLTDADRPKLDDEQIARINRLASGTVVNTIEFGTGPQKEKGNFLQKVAEGNAGEHKYVDVRKLEK